MKTIGIVGGMSWESSAEYYRLLNENIKARLGPTHSAELVMCSLDFHPIAQLELEEQWSDLAALIIRTVRRLENAGAEFVIMASNTVHKVAAEVQRSIGIPLLTSLMPRRRRSRKPGSPPSASWEPVSSWNKISIENGFALGE